MGENVFDQLLWRSSQLYGGLIDRHKKHSDSNMRFEGYMRLMAKNRDPDPSVRVKDLQKRY